jgi:hypothetical protein
MTTHPEAVEERRAEIEPDFVAQLEQIAARPGPHGPRVLISPALARALLCALAARPTPADTGEPSKICSVQPGELL